MLRGGCACGAVRYAVDAAPARETLCHCADCRKAAGAPAVAWFTVPRGAVRFTGARPAAFRSSPGVQRGFCAQCGTTLSWAADTQPDLIDLTICSLDAADDVAPRTHSFFAARLRWDAPGDALPRHPAWPPAD